MSFLSFFPLIPATTTASAAPVYHGGMIPCLGDVEPVNTQWLVKGYFPMGAVSVVAGPGGVGKGVFMADVTAAVTTGRPTTLFPDAAVTQGNVLVLTSEDDPGMSLAPRMLAAGADMRRVFYATPSWYWQQKKKKLVIGASLFELIDELRPALVVIDPLRSFLEGNAAANGDVMRGALDMLQEKASTDQFSVVIVSHMVKKAGDDARMLLAGSGELWNAARSVTILGRLPKDESITYVTQEKLNVGTKARSILFRTQTVSLKNKAGAEVETVRAVLAATTEKHYKELMADKPMPLEPSQQDAKESIMALLKEQGPMAGMDLKKLVMDETGCSKRTVERAHTWKVIDEKNVQEQRFVQLVCEQTKKQRPDIILHDSGVLVAQTIYGFDSSVMKKIEKFLREQKPELLHYQKFLENGTAERAKESGTEQNYNMIDGCVNNNPKKPRIIGNRISVLDRLHIKLEERKQKSQPQQQQQQERSRKN